jgi:uncharacterized protein (TIRG00374 family)
MFLRTSPRLKKALWLALKLAVLLVLVDYARRHAQLDDELAMLDAPAAQRAPETSARLVIVRKPSAGDATYGVRTREGASFSIPEAEVETDSRTGDHASYALLPGLRSLFASLSWGHLTLAFAIFGPALFVMAVRWHLLLCANDIRIPFFTLVRLHYLGFFYNTFMPGGAGGDILKAVHLAQHCTRKAEAATVVLVDRVVGLLGLLIVASASVVWSGGQSKGLAGQIGGLALLLIAGLGLYFSSTLRRVIHYDQWVSRLPRAELFIRIDNAIYGMRRHKKTLLLALTITVVLQLLEVVGVSWAGDALGLHKAHLRHYLAFVPIGFLVNAVPISFGGIGLLEGAFLKLFHDAGVATATQGFMLGVLTRVIILGWSALGAVSALFPPIARPVSPASMHA